MLQRGPPPRRARHRRRRRRTSRPTAGRNTAGPGRRPRGRPPATVDYRGRGRSRRWTSTPCSPASPQVALVDELAHTNVPGSRAREALAGRRGAARRRHRRDLAPSTSSTSSRSTTSSSASPASTQRETVPDAVVRAADQVELVDMTPEALRRRMAHGNIYGAEQGRRRPHQLLPGRQPHRPARAGAAVGGRQGRRRAHRLPGRPRHRPRPGRPGSGWSSR